MVTDKSLSVIQTRVVASQKLDHLISLNQLKEQDILKLFPFSLPESIFSSMEVEKYMPQTLLSSCFFVEKSKQN